jgi:non-specific protein-tyrosine kinase
MLDKVTTPVTGNVSSPKRILQVLLRRLWVIVLVAIVLTGSAVGFSLYQTPTYEASVKILVGQTSTPGNSLASDVEGLQQLALTMVEAVPTLPVAQAVAEELDMPVSAGALLGNLSAEQVPGTMFVDVSYKDSDPKKAQLVANAVGEVFSEKISEVGPGANSVTATVWQQATLPETPVSPDPVRNGILAFVLGTLLGVGLAFLLEYLDDSWESPEEVRQVSGVPTFGVIPTFEVLAGKKKGKQ